MQPLWNVPALRFDVRDEDGPGVALVASELHIGIESELARQGAFLRSRTRSLADRLLDAVRAAQADRLILLGDIKHRVTHQSRQERRDVPAFFERLAGLARVDIAVGNHDAGLRTLLPAAAFPNVRLHPAGGFLVDAADGTRVACLHGHAWPRPSLVAEADAFLVGHTHAAVAFVDEAGRRTSEWAWVRGRLDPARVRAKYGQDRPARVVVFPPFNPLCGGTPVNQDGLLGPFARLVDPATLEATLLDGRPFGAVLADATPEKPSRTARPSRNR